MNRKVMILVAMAVFLCLVPICLYADGTSFSFGIIWNFTNTPYATLTILDDSGGAMPTDNDLNMTKAADVSSEEQSIAIVRYKTNVLGTHKLYFKATPFGVEDGDGKAGYTLRFYISDGTNTADVSLDVGTDSTYYPTTENSCYVPLTYSSITGSANTSDIWTYLTLTDLGLMATGTWKSTMVVTGEAP